MNPQEPWPADAEEATALQSRLRRSVTRTGPAAHEIQRLAGLDVTYSKNDDRLIAAVVVLDAATLEVQDVVVHEDRPRFPYLPGLFSFRELPPLLAALEKLDHLPDLLMCDGHGLAHPRRFGLACHLGVTTRIPTIGVAKQALIGEYAEPGPRRGDRSPLTDKGEVLGTVLRTADHVKPVFVSIGHMISLEDACQVTLNSTPRYRISEPIRLADQASRRTLKSRQSHPTG
ncbi:endonuclease V [Sphaerisporangium melleum]|uniref:Endonuclease V n=1 Tax=Sphaerisporangium melleum TaxID=321316 RepID=A0A917RQ97_9ACTN|nr:deoxyribonuclease V [Sphaerisporangium melleum]GGL18436.1 endonuclease V [Sphaerisporangium melleum]GII74783.1 endonuclease V [Sphaerisporangium melleum]